MSSAQIELAKRKHALVADYQKFFTTISGKKVILDLMWSHYIASSFDKDPYVAAYNEGARSVVVRILHIMKTDPRKIQDFIKEAIDDRDSGYD